MNFGCTQHRPSKLVSAFVCTKFHLQILIRHLVTLPLYLPTGAIVFSNIDQIGRIDARLTLGYGTLQEVATHKATFDS